MQPVVLRPVQVVTVCVKCHTCVLRSGAYHLRGHRRGYAGGQVEETGSRVEQTDIILQELMAAAHKGREPRRFTRVKIEILVPRAERNRASSSIPHRCGVRENLLHARVGRERLSLHDSDSGKLSENLRIRGISRFRLDDPVDLLVELEGDRVNGVEIKTGTIDELRLRRICRLRRQCHPVPLAGPPSPWGRQSGPG